MKCSSCQQLLLFPLFTSLLQLLDMVAGEEYLDKPVKNLLNSNSFIQNAEHVMEHLKGKVDFDPEKVSTAELEWHFFKLHDLDSNRKLDGLEIFKALEHGLYDQLTQDKEDKDRSEQDAKQFLIKFNNYLIESVDLILKQDDKNNDGYLTYWEFKKGKAKDSITEMTVPEATVAA